MPVRKINTNLENIMKQIIQLEIAKITRKSFTPDGDNRTLDLNSALVHQHYSVDGVIGGTGPTTGKKIN